MGPKSVTFQAWLSACTAVQECSGCFNITMAWQDCAVVDHLVPDTLRHALQGASNGKPQRPGGYQKCIIRYVWLCPESRSCGEDIQRAQQGFTEVITLRENVSMMQERNLHTPSCVLYQMVDTLRHCRAFGGFILQYIKKWKQRIWQKEVKERKPTEFNMTQWNTNKEEPHSETSTHVSGKWECDVKVEIFIHL